VLGVPDPEGVGVWGEKIVDNQKGKEVKLPLLILSLICWTRTSTSLLWMPL